MKGNTRTPVITKVDNVLTSSFYFAFREVVEATFLNTTFKGESYKAKMKT
jgi:hypothetical protein